MRSGQQSDSAAQIDGRPTVPLDFLAGGGEMGARMRALDWTKTPLGTPASWPQSLKTIVRVILDSRYAMWMLWGAELTFFCNDAYLPTVGIKRDWVLGARSDKVWEEIWPDIGPRIQRVLERGLATWDEGLLLFLERSGFAEETYHTFSYSPVYDDDNRIAGMLCVVTEVSDRLIGERRLRLLRDLATRVTAIETVQQACERFVAVLAGDPLDVPFACLYVLDSSRERARLASSHGGIPERLRPTILDLAAANSPWPVAEAIASGEIQIVQLPDGPESISSPSWPEHVSRAIVLPVQGQGSSTSVAVLIAGVSPRRALDDGYRGFFDLVAGQFAAAIANAQAYEAERRRSDGLAEIDRAKTAFFSNVSHEFRTPLTLMLGPIATAIANPETPRVVREHLELAHRNSQRLLKLVNSLLDFSRVEAGRAQASYEATDIAVLTRDLASTFRSAIERAGLSFSVDCESLGNPVYLDREMWEKIVFNLLSNALKYTFTGEIAVRLRREGAGAVLEVADTGIGIPEKEIPRVFERFHRVEGSVGRTQEGSGIGLALVQELVTLHGGSVHVASELTRGTTFRVRLCFGAAHLPAERIKTPRAPDSTATHAQSYVQEALRWLPEVPGESDSRVAAPSGAPIVTQDRRFGATAGARIVLADDNADMRNYVRELLSPLYAVEVAADGQQAFEAAAREPPDLILSDVMMPRLDGFGLLKALRRSDTLRHVPIILLSARAGEESRIEGLDAGADDYLVKPFSARELLARVGALLERERLRRDALDHELALRRAAQALSERLESADRQKDEFLAMLAHELRNPLAPIRNAVELLSRMVPPESKIQSALDMTKRQVTQLSRLVDDLLDVSRITQRRIELKRRAVDLPGIIAHAVEAVEPLLSEKELKISITTSSYHPLHVNADPARLMQCIVNVLTNAAKYTDSGGAIQVQTGAQNATAVIEISDTGVGISPELLPRVFDLFVQGDRTLDRSQGGLGIGLSVVRRLVEMHDGQVSARSAGLGHGSTFEIRLPLIERPGGTAPETGSMRIAPSRILIVDDNQDATNSLALLLELEGHEVSAVYSAAAALQRARSFIPSIVLLDIGLPEMDGYEVAQRMRAMPELKGVRLVAITGYGQPEDRKRTKNAGFDDHLTKPVDLLSVERTIAGFPRTDPSEN
jgi:signal transduction histidine kinase